MKRFVKEVRDFLFTKFGKKQGQPDPEDTTPYPSGTEIQRCCVFEESDSDVVVGREDEVEELVSRLLHDNNESLRVISLIGDEALGKTALARNVYNRLDIRQHFPWRAWVHVSGDLECKALLLIILKQLPIRSLKNSELMSEEEMLDRLFLVLEEHRLLVVLDDLRTRDVWLKLVRAFADAFNGSRVILTTRDFNIAFQADPWSSPLNLRPLTEEKSWSLFLKKVGRPEYSQELNNLRGDILRICDGLPIAIVLLGGVLSALEFQEWTSMVIGLAEQRGGSQSALANIVDFGCKKLRNDLKLCFLYLAHFPKAYEIPIRRLLQLWIAEGFVQFIPDGDGRIPEDEANRYLEELVCRNMIEIAKWKSDGSPKTCRMPTYLYEYSVLRLADQFGGISTPESHIQCPSSYLSFDPRKGYKSNKDIGKDIGKFLNTRITSSSVKLKVLDLEGVYKPLLPKNLGKFQNLRYLGLRWTGLDTCPESVGDLPCLETLDLKYTNITTLPSSIWKAKKLRHLYMEEMSIEKPPKKSSPNLLTLMELHIGANSPYRYGLYKFTSLRKLGLTCDSTSAELTAKCISELGKLQTLRLKSRDPFGQPAKLVLAPLKEHQSLSNLYLFGKIGKKESIHNVPRNLRTLTLSMSERQYDPMPVLGELPQLNTLRLFARSYVGSKMTCPGPPAHFPNLRVLKMWKLEELEHWEVEQDAMPQLVELEIRCCEKLESSVELEKLDSLKELNLTNMPQKFVENIRTRMGRGILLTNKWEFSDLHIWTLWLNRNSMAFRGKHISPDIVKLCIAKAVEFHFLIQGSRPHAQKIQRSALWSKPSVGWFKLNTDASVLPSSGRAGGGGLLRDSNGAWVQGFSRHIGSSNVLLAELWALRDGLTMASNLHIEKLIIHVDASEVINLLSKPFNTNRLTQPIVTDCRSILQVFQEYRVQHCYRETNRVADLLANMGAIKMCSLFLLLILLLLCWRL